MNQKLLNAKALFQGHIPFRHIYYRYCRKPIMSGIRKKALLSLGEQDLFVAIHAIIPIEKEEVRKVSNSEKDAIIRSADKIMSNIFNYLGSGDVVLEPICWDIDFISGFKWEKGLYYKNYVQVNLDNHADVKVPRELSRSHFLLHLALAFVITGDDKYATKAFSLIENWIDNNPFLLSINWCCAMDVAIRAVNWIWAMAIMDGYAIPKQLSDKIVVSLYQHGWYVFRNLEGNRLAYNGNHYYSDLVGLMHLGLLFRNDREGGFWFDFGKKEMFREMRLQVLPSGMHYEGSTNYHRLVLELSLPCFSLLKMNGEAIPPDIEARLKSMFDFIKLVVMPNGEMPIIGDQDNGRCLPFGVEDINDYRYLLELGSYLYEGKEDSNVYCLLMNDLRTNAFPPVVQQGIIQRLTLLKDAGFVLYKDDDWYCLINTDNQGMYRDETISTGHTHADWLSFVLAYKGIPFLIDPGTYVYSSHPDLRNMFRSTVMHNTISIDGRSQALIPEKQLWSLPRKGECEVNYLSSEGEIVRFSCCHNAYSDLKETIKVNRYFKFDSKESCMTIEDKVQTVQHHKLDICYYLSPCVEAVVKEHMVMLRSTNAALIVNFVLPAQAELTLEDCEVSDSYGNLTSSKKMHIKSNFFGEFAYSVVFLKKR